MIEKLPADEFAADIGSEAYAKLVEQARDINVVDVVRNLSISGSFKDLPFSFNEKGLRLFLALSVPPIAIASVKRLQFRPPTKEEDEKDNTLGFRRWSDELGGSEIVISDVKVHEHYESTLKLLGNISKAKQFAESETKDFMLYGILHEFAHEFHHTLPLAALKRWEDQRVTDPTNITPYVKKCFDEKLVNPYVEDFAESSAFFGLKPYVLNNISSTRFKAMQELMSDFMPIYDKILQNEGMNNDKQRFKEMGMSDEDVRKIYLEHEGKP